MSYTMLWLTYALAIIFTCFGSWLLFSRLWNNFWISVSFCMVALLFLVPFGLEAEYYSGAWMAPALVVMAFEAIAENDNLVRGTFRSIILVECTALFLVLLFSIVRRRQRSE